MIHLGGLQQRPNLLADGRQLRRIHRRNGGVLVKQLLQASNIPIRLRPGHGRNHVVDQGGVGAPLRLGALTRVIHQERVDERQLMNRLIRVAPVGQAGVLPRQPLHVAVLAHVHDSVRPKHLTQPKIGAQIVVVRGQIRVVVNPHRVIAKPARRLHHHHHIAELQAGNINLLRVRVHIVRAGGRAPMLRHLLLHGFGQGGEKLLVGVGGQLQRVRGQHLLGQPLWVVPAGLNDCVHEGVPIQITVDGEPGNVFHITKVVAGLVQGPQHPQGRQRGIQPHRVTDAGVLGRIRGEHEHQLLLPVRNVPQPGMPVGDTGQAGAPLRIRHIGNQPLGVIFLKRERHGNQPAIKLGHRNLRRHIPWAQPLIGFFPLGPGIRQGQPLDNRNVQCGELRNIPRLIIPAGPHTGGFRPAGRQHRGDERITRRKFRQ